MAAALRPLATLVVGLALLAGCGEDEPSSKTADDPTTSRAPTTSTEPPTGTVSPAEDPVSVTLYDADFTVSDAGDLTVVETLTLDVPVDDRHGIFRTFEAVAEVEDFTATLDGGETPIAVSVEDGFRKFKIGDPDQTLSVGEHVVRMEYGVSDVLTVGGSGVRSFDWHLVPGDWSLRIGAAELTVQLPVPATDVECTVGRSDPCDLSGAGTSTLVVTVDALGDRTPVRLRAGVPLPADA
jgi:hypothetical protein